MFVALLIYDYERNLTLIYLSNPFNQISSSQSNKMLRLNFIADGTEKRLINEVYDFAKSIAELQLTESELALYSALVLLQPGKLNFISP